ncbi:M23 family metallopeptidase [Loktanella sp. DJP18]|uniref:M23 family metallopeptidase n=1 Tax=Loktanella sp. DJP18 TaxID=3409788 RepID=UPI003BB53FF4
MLVAGSVALGIVLHMDSEAGGAVSSAGKADVATQQDRPSVRNGAAANPIPTNPAPAKDLITWTGVVAPGDSLSGLLAQAGLDTDQIREVTGALGSAFDLRRLQPGHSLALTLADDGDPDTVTLEIEDGSRIQATFGDAPTVQKLAPRLDSIRRAGEATVGSSIYAALDRAGIPTRFATDLELILAETFDLRTRLSGGEHFRLMWREHRSGDRVVGDPTIDFAQLDLADGRYDILWPDDTSRRTRIFKDGRLIQTFDQPIRGARLSSSFGLRMHPVHGTMRMHSGLDFAADQGAVVEATQAGKVAFMGERSGYGNIVEVDHGNGVQTRYAHLSALDEDLRVGQRVAAGTELGLAGSTGTSTAPHLHYEIRVDGKPVSPLADERLTGTGSQGRAARSPVLVHDMESALDKLLASNG